jgi:hypothetical protein
MNQHASKTSVPPSVGGPLRASYGSASQPAIIIGKDSGKADAVLAPN